jgi:hypothetical protein
MWAHDCLSAVRIIGRVRRCERRHEILPPGIMNWRPRGAGIQSIALGVSARYGLHPPDVSTHKVDQRLMPFVCAAHRLAGSLTSGLGLPGRPMLCISLNGVRFPAVCMHHKGARLAALVFQDQIKPEDVSAWRIEAHGVPGKWPAAVKGVATPLSAMDNALSVTFFAGTTALMVECRRETGKLCRCTDMMTDCPAAAMPNPAQFASASHSAPHRPTVPTGATLPGVLPPCPRSRLRLP